MNATNFNPGTVFTYGDTVYMVTKKTALPADNRFKAVWVAIVPQSVKEFEEMDGKADGFFALTELKEWRKKGIIYNIINPAI